MTPEELEHLWKQQTAFWPEPWEWDRGRVEDGNGNGVPVDAKYAIVATNMLPLLIELWKRAKAIRDCPDCDLDDHHVREMLPALKALEAFKP